MLSDAIRDGCAEYAGSSEGLLRDLGGTLASIAAISLPSVLALLRSALGSSAGEDGHRDAEIAQDGIFEQLMDAFASLGSVADEEQVLVPTARLRSITDHFSMVAGIATARAASSCLVQSPLAQRPIALLLPGDAAAVVALAETVRRLGSKAGDALMSHSVLGRWSETASSASGPVQASGIASAIQLLAKLAAARGSSESAEEAATAYAAGPRPAQVDTMPMAPSEARKRAIMLE
jgi:hypothetical protein